MEINTKKAGIAVIAGCAAACAGAAVVPALLGGAVVGGLAVTEGGILAALAAIGVAGWFWMRRRARKAACACAPEQGCNSGPSCDLAAK